MNPAARTASRREAAASAAVVLLLVLVAAGVLVRQTSFSPAITETQAGQGGAGAGAIVARFPAGLEPMSAPESFDRETLSDKIDGRAELYLASGFVGLRTQRVRMTGDAGAWVEAFVYDMGSPRNAFSVFSTQRREGSPSLGFARSGYRTDNSANLVAGSTYIEVVASRPGREAMRLVEALARELAAAGEGAGAGAAAADDGLADGALFPKEGLVPGSVQLVIADAFGFGRFTNVFTARYRDGSGTVTAFLSRRASLDEAKALAAAWREFLVDLDGKEAAVPGLAGAWIIDMDGSFEGALVEGKIIAGVHQAGSAGVAVRTLERMRAALAGKAP